MKVLQINTVYGEGSTGKIAMEIHDICKKNDIDCLSACRAFGDIKEDALEISGKFGGRVHGFLAKFTMLKGCFSYFKTCRFLKKVSEYSPDIIHLHNLHGSYVNIGLVMRYIKKNRIPTVFTLHDCWAFTGICSHFALAGCEKWKTGCGDCPQKNKYSSCPLDLTHKEWSLKKEWFTGIEKMTVVTPSKWLFDLVKESFLQEYPSRIIYNGIDLQTFMPVKSDFKANMGIEDKKLVLAVAFGWNYGKGIDIISELARRLPMEYKVAVVGTDDETDKILPSCVLKIHKTNNQKELAEIYTAADVLVNPTREEVLGLVNVEALACGTPVVTFAAGGSPECVDETCGTVVPKDDVDAMEREVRRICTEHPYSVEACTVRARLFDKTRMLNEYTELYKSIER